MSFARAWGRGGSTSIMPSIYFSRKFVSVASGPLGIEGTSTMKLEEFRHLLSLVLQKAHIVFSADVL